MIPHRIMGYFWGCIVLLGGIIFFPSCSTAPVYAPANIDREQSWRSINWDGEGRCTFVYHDQQDRFRMETNLNRLAHTWILVVRLPMLGEEYLKINYQNGLIDGPLWQRWQKQNPHADIRSLKQALMQVLRLHKIPRHATWDQQVLAFTGSPGVHWQFDHWKNGRFYRAQVTFEEIYEYPLKLELEWREAD